MSSNKTLFIITSLENIENASNSTLIFSILTKNPSKFLFNKLIPFALASPLK